MLPVQMATCPDFSCRYDHGRGDCRSRRRWEHRLGDHCHMPETTAEIVARLARSTPGVTEATIQSDVRSLILSSHLNLTEREVAEPVSLEAQVGEGTRKRIDIEVSTTVIEVKKDLDAGQTLEDAEVQLAEYVHRRVRQTGARFYGILTDGHTWRLYIPEVADGQGLSYVSQVRIKSVTDEHRLLDWLGAILSRVENVYPTPALIGLALGADSPAYLADRATLRALYEPSASDPETRLKHELWAKLLTTAFGEDFDDDTDLFIDHTLLVLTAEIIAHAVLGFDVSKAGTLTPADLASGAQFSKARVAGVVESDFFDWPLRVDGGAEFVAALAHRLSRFDWGDVDHDVLKHVYESVVTSETRQQLGEYYTPDWLAQMMIDELDYVPLEAHVLDASCGSGTFLFHAVRRHLEAAEDAGISNRDALDDVVTKVYGMDIHPVAVALARVTYILAIGTGRLRRDRGPISIPVFIGDSLQWEQSKNLFADADSVNIPTSGSHILSEGEGLLLDDALRIPVSVMRDTQRFDTIISRISDQVLTYEPPKSDGENLTKAVLSFKKNLARVLGPNKFTDDELDALVDTGARMYELELTGRNHIWSYYVRNLIRPVWLSMPQNRVDVLIGNPPWLRYNKMNGWMQKKFLEHSKDHNLLSGALGASGRDLATLFVVRACELYLVDGGEFAYVMPHSALTRKPSAGFRAGKWAMRSGVKDIARSAQFSSTWDLQKATTGFPITSGVIFGSASTRGPRAMPVVVTAFTGRFSPPSQPWEKVRDKIAITASNLSQIAAGDLPKSPYGARFRQGAILVPRRLLWAEEVDAGPLGTAGSLVPLQSRVSTIDKDPWKIDPIQESVDRRFVFRGYLGEHLLPFRTLEPGKVVLPIRDGKLLTPTQALNEQGLSGWWRKAENYWAKHKKTGTKDDLAERVDYHGQLSAQLEVKSQYLVMYPKSGNNIAATYVEYDQDIMVDHKAYWMPTDSLGEARYITGILNSQAIADRVAPLQAVGLFGARDFDKYVFAIPFGAFDAANAEHNQFVELVERAEEIATDVDLSGRKTFQAKRKAIRAALDDNGVGRQLEALALIILPEVEV